MSGKHTPGPWFWTDAHGGAMLMGERGGRPVVLAARRKGMNGATIEVRSRGEVPRLVPVEDEPDHPDLALIAAAPDLLAACELALADIKEWMDASGNNPMECARSEEVTAALRAAMAKARGAP